MGKSKAPKPYDAKTAINAQLDANNTAFRQSAKAAGRSGPFGSSQYTFGASGDPEGIETKLSGPLNSAASRTMGRVDDWSNYLPDRPFRLSDVPSGRDVADSLFRQGENYLKPIHEQQNEQLKLQLFERGIPMGQNDIYRDSTQNLADSQNRQWTDLAMRANQAASAEQDRLIGHELLERNEPFKNISAGIGLMGGMGSLVPQAANIGNAQAPDAIGAYNNQYRAALDQYNQQQTGIQQALRLGLGLATTPLTGPMGLSNSLLGRGVSYLGSKFGGPSDADNDAGGWYPMPS